MWKIIPDNFINFLSDFQKLNCIVCKIDDWMIDVLIFSQKM